MQILQYFEPQLAFVILAGVCITLVSLLLFVVVLVMRQLAQRRERNHLRAMLHWRQQLGAVLQGQAVPALSLPARDLAGFVDAWNAVHDELQGENHPGVLQLATQILLAPKLERIIARGSFHDRVMTIIALGHLRNHGSFDKLVGLIDDASPIISISAARALMRIDPERAVQWVMPQIVGRHDWVDGGVAQILSEARPETVKHELGAAVLRANDEVAPRLVRFLAGVSPEAAAPAISKLLAEPHDEHLVSTCLQVMSDPADLDKVRGLLGHMRWHVRMHAAAAIGRLGNVGDAAALEPLLADAQWWVRYRTAQALQQLLQAQPQRLQQLRDIQTDRFARDILTQVIAENALGATA